VPLVGAFVPLLFGLYWSKANTQGAVFSMALGLVTWLVLLASPLGEDIPAQLAGLLAAVLGMLVGSLAPQWVPNSRSTHHKHLGVDA
jgi:Na+/proline symporter